MDSTIHSISINLILGTTNTSLVRMFVAPATNVSTHPSSDNSVAIESTFLGLSARIYNNDQLFRLNTTYRILISTNVATSFTLFYQTNQRITKIKGSKLDTYELVQYNERNCYEYTINDPNTTLEIYLSAYSGDPNIYVNPLTLLPNVENFAFSSKGFLNEQITITPEQRSSLGALTGNYYICVFGLFAGSYNLMIYTEKEGTQAKIPLLSALTRTMNVKTQELKVYEYSVKKNLTAIIYFHLATISGNADLYVKFCSTLLDDFGNPQVSCELRKEDLSSPTILKSTQVSSVDSISLSYSPNLCTGYHVSCSYLIGVYGVVDSKYSITVFADDQQEIPLAEGIPTFGYVGLRHFTYYSFIVQNPNTTSLKIQLTSISGDADLYISRINPNCGCKRAERCSSLDSFLPDAVYYQKDKDGPLNTSFHISVFGFTQASFTISYSTTVPSEPIKPIRLFDGNPQSGTINSTKSQFDSVLYEFSVSFSDLYKRDIKITLTAFSGNYDIYVAAGYVPSPNNFLWRSTLNSNSLHILTTDPGYKKIGTYNILVKKHLLEDTTPHLFNIKYSTGTFLSTIIEGSPEVGNLTKDNVEYFKYHVVNLTGSLTITLTPFSGNPDLYISINGSNQFPSKRQADYISAAIGADAIMVPLYEFHSKNANCFSAGFTSRECALYIAVFCSTSECSFSLQISRKDSSFSNLLEGIPQFGVIQAGEPKFYSFTPSQLNTSTFISVYPQRGKVKLYANVFSLGKQASGESYFPSPLNYSQVSIDRVNTEVMEIKSKKIGAFWQFYLGVYDIMNASSSFTIVATSNLRELVDGQTTSDSVKANAYKYYYFRVSCKNCTFSISVSPLSSGNPDLYVNKGSERLPTLEKCDFKQANYRSDFLQISYKDDFFVQSRQNISGIYTIAVHGTENCTYSISATTSTNIMQELTQGVPSSQVQERGNVKYFAFYSWRKSNILISLTMHTGSAKIRANVVPNMREVNVLEKLPSKEKLSEWSSFKSNTINSLLIQATNSNFLDRGIYFIGVEAEEACNYDITIVYASEIDYSYIKIGENARILLKKGELKLLAFIIESNANIKIRTNIFYGSIEATTATEPNEISKWNSNGDMEIERNDKDFKIGTYYMKIKGMQDSELTVRVEQKIEFLRLDEGIPIKSEIISARPTYFIFGELGPTINSDDQIHWSIQVKFLDPVKDPALFIRYSHREENASLPNKNEYNYKFSYDKDLQLLGGTVLLRPSLGPFLIIAVTGIINNPQNKVKFDIIAWTTGVVLLQPGNLYYNHFDSERIVCMAIGCPKNDDIHIYELSTQHVQRAYIEVIPCSGEVEFFVTKNLVGLRDRKYDLKKSELSKGRLFGSLESPQGTYYVSVRGVSKLNGNGTIRYSIRSILSNESNVANLEDFYLEQYGNILFTLDGENIKLNWGSIRKRESLLDQNQFIPKYAVYMSEDNSTNMHTVCGIKYGKVQKIAENIEETSLTYHINSENNHKVLSFNVIAKVEKNEQSIAYNPIYIQVSQKQKDYLTFFRKKILLFLFSFYGRISYFPWCGSNLLLLQI